MYNFSGSSNLAKAVKDAVFIQECKKEHYAFKIIIFQILDALVDDNVILSTSTSMTPLTLFSDKIKHKSHVSSFMKLLHISGNPKLVIVFFNIIRVS